MHDGEPGATHGEVPLHLPGGRGLVAVRWRSTNRGVYASLWYGDRQLTVSTSVIEYRNGTRTQDEKLGISEFYCAQLMHGLPPAGGVLSPKPERGMSGLALLQRSRVVPANTTQWVLEVGHGADGVIYNTHLIASCKIELEIDLGEMLAWYFETSSFDDG